MFSLRGHSRSRSRSRAAPNGSASISDPLELPTAATSSSNIKNILDPRASENTFRERDNGRRRLYGSAENNISVRSRRYGRFFARSLTNDDATNPPRPVQKAGRHPSLSLSPWKDVIFFSSISDRTIGPNNRLTRQRLINEWMRSRVPLSNLSKLPL